MAENSYKKSKNHRRKKRLMMKTGILLVLLVILGGAIWMLVGQIKKNQDNRQLTQSDQPDAAAQNPQDNEEVLASKEPKTEEASSNDAKEKIGNKEDILSKAQLLANQYDYDKAIEMLAQVPGSESDGDVAAKKAEYQAAKDSCVPVNPNEVTHIFYHSLVVDADKCFGNLSDPLTAGFNQWMTTVEEFKRITQEMYDKGYVLVRLRDLVNQTVDADGTVHFTPAQIMLPPGKKAFVLSIDDLNYYHSYDNHGIASRLVLNESGQLINEYLNDDGTVTTGDFDVVPLMDKFIAEHPDASYRGAKGLIAMTGYDGVFGYRTDGVYESRDPEHLTSDQKAWLDKHPDFNYAKEVEEAKKVAEAIKAQGWEFSNHTWGHRHIAQITLDDLKTDTEKWLNYVEPIVGSADTIIFAHGEDLGDWRDYNAADEKFQYLKSVGFNFFCNVDSAQYFLQIRDNYVRQGRRNLDGYRLYQDKIATDETTKKTKDLFDAAAVYDVRRPNVPEL